MPGSTFLLAGVALGLAFTLAILMGCLAAMRPRSWIDHLVNVISRASVSVVQFWFGLVLIIVVSVHLGLLPTGGYGSWQHLVLPAITLAARPLGAGIGMTAVLHTWGSALTHHPHIHMIVPGGGMSPGGTRWIVCRPGFFLPVQVLSRFFRRLFLDGLLDLHQSGRLVFFGDHAG